MRHHLCNHRVGSSTDVLRSADDTSGTILTKLYTRFRIDPSRYPGAGGHAPAEG
jgi:hypothetical protein